MSGQSAETAKPRWRRAVGLRVAAVLIGAIALALAWFAGVVREDRRVKEMILAHDGLYFYEYEPQTITRYTRTTWVPAWLRSIIGEDYFHDVTFVRIEGARFGDAELGRMRSLDRIESLGIVETALTDDGLRHLRGRKALKGLWLGGNWIGDRGIDNMGLETLPQLEVLELRSTMVSDAKLAEIKSRFPKLMVLVDGPSHRWILPGRGRGNHRMTKPGNDALGPARKVPPLRHR